MYCYNIESSPVTVTLKQLLSIGSCFPSFLPFHILFRCVQTEDEQMLRSMKSCVNETLTTVAQYFGQLIELVLTHEAQVSLQSLKKKKKEVLSNC